MGGLFACGVLLCFFSWCQFVEFEFVLIVKLVKTKTCGEENVFFIQQ